MKLAIIFLSLGIAFAANAGLVVCGIKKTSEAPGGSTTIIVPGSEVLFDSLTFRIDLLKNIDGTRYQLTGARNNEKNEGVVFNVWAGNRWQLVGLMSVPSTVRNGLWGKWTGKTEGVIHSVPNVSSPTQVGAYCEALSESEAVIRAFNKSHMKSDDE
jgi:hypothetical protein